MRRANKPWDKKIELLLVCIVFLNIAPHMFAIPLWVSIASAAFLAWKMLYLFRSLPLPPRVLLYIAALAGAVGVYAEYQTLIGADAASALLAFLASAKLLETNRYRDAMLVIFTSFFLLMAHLLHSQSIPTTAFMAVDVFLITLLMFQINKRDRGDSLRAFAPALKMLAISLPIWVFLFLVFPRFQTGFWQNDTRRAPGTGFSDEIDPGSVAELAQDDTPVFRVTFDGQVKSSPEGLYWRGVVLTHAEGLRWTRGRPISSQLQAPPIETGPEVEKKIIRYEVMLEPTERKFLFALERPVTLTVPALSSAGGVRRLSDFTFETRRTVSTPLMYEGTSLKSAPAESLSPKAREALLELPPDLDARILALAHELSKGTKTAEEKSERVLTWFETQGFRYNLNLGSHRSTRLEQFLFENRVGFCEHFAAAYATLMRAMGVPSRVAVGFQGGRYNRYGGYWLVRNMDAHAWAEILSDGRWLRVDPTAHIAPGRITLGADYLGLGDEAMRAGVSAEQLERRLGGVARAFLSLDLAWDAAQLRWNTFLVQYDFDYQRALLAGLGLARAPRLFLFVMLTVGLAALLVALRWWLGRTARREDPVLECWRDFCDAMARLGLAREETEGPLHYAQRASNLRPDLAGDIQFIAERFIELRYGDVSSSAHARKLKSLRYSVRRVSMAASSRVASS